MSESAKSTTLYDLCIIGASCWRERPSRGKDYLTSARVLIVDLRERLCRSVARPIPLCASSSALPTLYRW